MEIQKVRTGQTHFEADNDILTNQKALGIKRGTTTYTYKPSEVLSRDQYSTIIQHIAELGDRVNAAEHSRETQRKLAEKHIEQKHELYEELADYQRQTYAYMTLSVILSASLLTVLIILG